MTRVGGIFSTAWAGCGRLEESDSIKIGTSLILLMRIIIINKCRNVNNNERYMTVALNGVLNTVKGYRVLLMALAEASFSLGNKHQCAGAAMGAWIVIHFHSVQ